MQVIPVIDLKGGTVVHARRGQRDQYRPIVTPLARGCDPIGVVSGLLSVHPFATLYIADLDAIARIGDNGGAIEQLKRRFPQFTFWIDSGIRTLAGARGWLARGLGELVLGSESLADTATASRLAGDPHVVLSLDFRGAGLQGPADLLGNAAAWPRRVIAMTLDRVGSHAGPDLERLRAIKDLAGRREVYAAGGIRDAADLRALAQASIAGALVATALHDGRISSADLKAL
jgi:phosphoribosylformimino-5-aminoimidazole carboxamide ribotide isomerase